MANINIYGELYNDTPNGYVAPATQIKDVDLGKTQDRINAELAASGSASEANTGYVTCGTVAATAAKEINDTTTLAGFVLDQNIRLLVKMTYTNTAASPTLNINSTGAKAIIYNGAAASADNSWNANEILDVFYDGSQYVSRPCRDIDAEPIAGSENLVKSGGVQNELALGAVYDVSAKNPTAGPNNDGKWESLSALLSDANLNTLIPTSVRKGGMSIKFVQSSDNKYVQYRLTIDEFSNNVDNWERYNDITTSNQQDSDLDISDEEGNILARFQNGHIKTKNFDSSKDASEEERGLMSAEDKIKLNSIEGGAEVNDVITDDVEEVDLNFSDEDGNVLIQAKNGHIKTKNFDSSKTLLNRYLPYRRRTYFAQSVNTFNFLTTDFVAESVNTYDEPVYYNDNVVLYLPESYSENNKPTKLIIYCKHGASTIEPSSDGILTGSMGRIFRYMLHLGYGILAADGVPNDWATAKKLGERAVGNYVAVESTIRAFEYVKEKYNIDHDNVYIFGYSQGGHYAQNVIDNSNIPIAAAAELSPVCSMRYHQWDLNVSGTVDGVSYTKLARLNIARIFDFSTVSNNTELLALEYDPAKTVGYDPWNRNVDNMFTGFEKNSSDLWVLPNSTSLNDIIMKKHIRCPLKIWAANNDNVLGVDVMKVFIKAVKNSGQAADLQLYTSGAHSIPTSQSTIGTFVENGETCNLYPIALDIASWFFQFGGYKLV